MKLTNLLIVGGLSLVALSLLKPKIMGGTSSPTSASQVEDITTQTLISTTGQKVVLNTLSPTEGVAKIVATSGGFDVTATADPRLYRVSEAGGGSHIQAITTKLSDSAISASKKANAQEIARLKPEYKNTLAYKKVMAS